jgi:glucose uptake protein GlcU
MSLVRLLGFRTLTCGCISGRYWEIGASREVRYIEEKGAACANPAHQRNQPVSPDRVARGFSSRQAS